jgi:hypothetical protein
MGCGGASKVTNEEAADLPENGSGTVEQMGRDAAIYGAVVKRLIKEDNTFGGGDPGFGVVYVMNGAVKDAADPMNPVTEYKVEEPFSHDVQDGVRFLSKLADLPPVEFVAERDAVVTGEHGGTRPGHVKNRGVLVGLGPIEEAGNTVEVQTSLWINGLAGQWLTYVLAERDGAWKVTGTTGQMAIS